METYQDKCEKLYEDHEKLKEHYKALQQYNLKLETIISNISVQLSKLEKINGKEN